MTNSMILLLFLSTVVLFFWGVYRTVKTQKKIYLLAFFPFILLIITMFLM